MLATGDDFKVLLLRFTRKSVRTGLLNGFNKLES